MNKEENVIGRKYNRLLILEELYNYNRRTFLCLCDCGIYKKVALNVLKSGNTKSCGCYSKYKSSQRKGVSNTHNIVHGMINTSEYKSWCSMKERCYNVNNKKYKDYGGRGITICDMWLNSFENFYADMGAKPSESHSIDRIDVNGNYEPNNCRWATKKQQSNNKRNNIFYEYKNKKMTLGDISELVNVSYQLLWNRIHKQKMSLEDAIKYNNKLYLYNNEYLNLTQIAKIINIPMRTLWNRINIMKLNIEEAINYKK